MEENRRFRKVNAGKRADCCMLNNLVLCVVTLILAFCSIVYELLLGQALSAFLGNTVLRYSVTVGLYLLSMGVGSYFAEGRFIRYSALTLLWIEVVLALFGGSSIVALHLVHSAQLGDFTVFLFGHALIVLIGVLTGFEIPLLMDLWRRSNSSEGITVLGVNYVGAFAGTVAFALLFYPATGLVGTAFLIALLNAIAGSLLGIFGKGFRKAKRRRFLTAAAAQPLVAALFAGGLLFLENIEAYLDFLYISAGAV